MKNKTICFCIRRRNRKTKESRVEDLEKLSHVKPKHKGKTKGCDPRTFVGDGDGGGGGFNVHGGSIVAGNDEGVAAAVMTAAHMSLMSAYDCQDGSGNCHGGESGADGGGD
ncbi:unnamed protein product [Sphenostylis stenocarpa]|uniref:Uncharacterized protein n=1 Tax=Sphenostylis stenocarpa TaxID=92480 RepID=A0AA86T6T9_9FABA|nr:unnamed protein product [Sphenostylis stenocarpa]